MKSLRQVWAAAQRILMQKDIRPSTAGCLWILWERGSRGGYFSLSAGRNNSVS